jgi:hypothetical protein
MAIGGPQVRATGRIEAHIADLTATLLARLGVSVPTVFRGRVLWEALATSGKTTTLPDVDVKKADARRGEAVIEKRLRALGYVE